MTESEDTHGSADNGARRLEPLANLRANSEVIRAAIAEIDSIKGWSVIIGISPRDDVLSNNKRGEITHTIYNMCRGARERLQDGNIVPVRNLSLALVGEYSDKHRWHYHGLIKVDNILVLERFKNNLSRRIGRTISEQLKDYNTYIKYIFKQYTENNMFYPYDNKDCFLFYSKVNNCILRKPGGLTAQARKSNSLSCCDP